MTVSGSSSPYADGWFFRIKVSNPSELDDMMDAERYLMAIEDE